MIKPASDDFLSCKAFKDIADAVPVALWWIDSSFKHDWANKRWLELTGGRLEEEIGFAWAEKLHPDDREMVVEEFDRAFEARVATTVEFRLLGKDGRYRWFLDSGAPLYRDGKFAGFVGSCIDISEKKEAEAQIRWLQAKLIKLSWADVMSAVGAAMAREVSQTLHVISACSDRLERLIGRRDGLPPGLAEAATSIKLASRHAIELVKSSKRMTSTRSTERVREDLSVVLRAVDPLIRIHPTAVGVTIKWELAAGLHVTVSRIQIGQVLLSLVTNALHAMQDMPVRAVDISTIKWGDVAVVSVADRSPGLTHIMKEKIFEPSTASREDDIGLRLYVSHLIISAYGGRLWVDDNPSGGSIFRFTLPLDISSDR